MKKLFCLIVLFSLCAGMLSACGLTGSGGEAPRETAESRAPSATAVPEEGSHGEEDQSLAVAAMPTLEPVEALPGNPDDGGNSQGADDGYFDIDALINRSIDEAEGGDATQSAIENLTDVATGGFDPSTYQYTALTDTALGFTFNYPSHWVNVPGVYTVCFREPAEDGKFPARVAISVKRLVHTPDEEALTEQLTSYMRIIHKQYDNATFESGTPNTQDTFMGQQAFSNTYLAFSGDTEVKGFVLGTAVGRVMCVFHFCAAYEDYVAMESVMRYMARSVQAVQSN